MNPSRKICYTGTSISVGFTAVVTLSFKLVATGWRDGFIITICDQVQPPIEVAGSLHQKESRGRSRWVVGDGDDWF